MNMKNNITQCLLKYILYMYVCVYVTSDTFNEYTYDIDSSSQLVIT